MLNELTLSKQYDSLPIRVFAQILQSPTQSYKFFWFEAILNLCGQKPHLYFEELMDQILLNAWPLVAVFHLRLGPEITGKKSDVIAETITLLSSFLPDSSVTKTEVIKKLMNEHPDIMKDYYDKLEKCVPYRLLSPFLKPYGIKNADYNRLSTMFSVIDQLAENNEVPYRIWIDSQNRKGIDILDSWLEFFREQNPILMAWDQFEKALYLQKRNPSVPGIVSKVNWKNEEEGSRHLKNARNLWKAIAELYPDEFVSIYTGNKLDKKKFELDHFIPWSFTASDELFNLVPIEKEVNIQKSNYLPDWPLYFSGLVRMQSLLRRAVKEYPVLYDLFKKCQRDNLNEDWERNELYRSNLRDQAATLLLEKKVRPLWDTALMQGFTKWTYKEIIKK